MGRSFHGLSQVMETKGETSTQSDVSFMPLDELSMTSFPPKLARAQLPTTAGLGTT